MKFRDFERAPLTVMVQARTAERALELVQKSLPLGADAFGLQACKLEDRSEKAVRTIIDSMEGKPCYITNYRHHQNDGKSDDELAKELLEFACRGGTLIDMMGDFFDRREGEYSNDKTAVQKQMQLVDKLHEKGAEVLISSHIMKFTPAERVLEIALGHKARGADISKIVTGADTMEQQIENLRIVDLLKRELGIPFLFLSGGESKILRRIGPTLGCCMYLCVYEHDELSTKHQPLLSDLVTLRELI